MALQALLILGGVGEPLRGKLWTFDGLTGRVRVLRMQRAESGGQRAER